MSRVFGTYFWDTPNCCSYWSLRHRLRYVQIWLRMSIKLSGQSYIFREKQCSVGNPGPWPGRKASQSLSPRRAMTHYDGLQGFGGAEGFSCHLNTLEKHNKNIHIFLTKQSMSRDGSNILKGFLPFSTCHCCRCMFCDGVEPTAPSGNAGKRCSVPFSSFSLIRWMR